MAEIRLPLSITYETTGATPLSDIIASLQATDVLAREAIALVPQFIPGIVVEKCSLNVLHLSQESPLRELFMFSLIIAFQDSLEAEVPPMLEDLFKVEVSSDYDTLVTVIFMIVLFYGADYSIQAVKKIVSNQKLKKKYDEVLQDLSSATGQTKEEIEQILEKRFGKPALMKRLIENAQRFFLPSHREGGAPIQIDRSDIEEDAIREVPFLGSVDSPADLSKYEPRQDVVLEIHAQDRDKGSTGWAAIAEEISDQRLRMKIMDPVKPEQLWGRDTIRGNIVIVSKLTAYGYRPTEIHLTEVL